MLNQPPNYEISLLIDQTEIASRLWPCLPRIGESVEPESGEKYKIVDIVHAFRQTSPQITLVLQKKD